MQQCRAGSNVIFFYPIEIIAEDSHGYFRLTSAGMDERAGNYGHPYIDHTKEHPALSLCADTSAGAAMSEAVLSASYGVNTT